MSNTLPTVTAVIEKLCKEYEQKMNRILNIIRVAKRLCKPLKFQQGDSLKQKVACPKEKPVSKYSNHPLPGTAKRDLKRPDPTVDQKEVNPKLLEKCINIIDNIEVKDTRSSKRNHFLRSLKERWAAENETLKLYEPELPELSDTLYKYLADNNMKCKNLNWTFNDLKEIRKLENIEEEAMQHAQDRVTNALCEDLKVLDFNSLDGEKNKQMLVGFHRLITSLDDITQLKSHIIVHGIIFYRYLDCPGFQANNFLCPLTLRHRSAYRIVKYNYKIWNI